MCASIFCILRVTPYRNVLMSTNQISTPFKDGNAEQDKIRKLKDWIIHFVFEWRVMKMRFDISLHIFSILSTANPASVVQENFPVSAIFIPLQLPDLKYVHWWFCCVIDIELVMRSPDNNSAHYIHCIFLNWDNYSNAAVILGGEVIMLWTRYSHNQISN